MPIPLAMGLLGAGRRAKCRPGWRARADDGDGESGPGRGCLALSEARQSFRFVDLRGSAGAVAAARVFGAGQTGGRAARPAEVSGGPRHRAVRALGCGTAGRGPRPARPGRGVARRPARRRRSTPISSRRRGRPSPTPANDPAFAAEALALPSEAFLADQMAVVDVDADPCRARGRARRNRPRRSPANSPPPMTRSPIPAPTASTVRRSAGGRCAMPCLGYLAAGDPGLACGARQGAVRRRRQHDRRAGGARGAGRSRPARARGGAGAFLCQPGRTTRWSSTNGSPAGALVIAGHAGAGAGARRASGLRAQQPEPGARAGRRLRPGQPGAVSRCVRCAATPFSPTR